MNARGPFKPQEGNFTSKPALDGFDGSSTSYPFIIIVIAALSAGGKRSLCLQTCCQTGKNTRQLLYSVPVCLLAMTIQTRMHMHACRTHTYAHTAEWLAADTGEVWRRKEISLPHCSTKRR